MDVQADKQAHGQATRHLDEKTFSETNRQVARPYKGSTALVGFVPKSSTFQLIGTLQILLKIYLTAQRPFWFRKR